MIIDDKYDLNDFVASEDSFMKKHNNIYISNEQVNILKKYNIDINKFNNINELIFAIEEYLNISNEYVEELDRVSQTLSEYNYYANTNK